MVTGSNGASVYLFPGLHHFFLPQQLEGKSSSKHHNKENHYSSKYNLHYSRLFTAILNELHIKYSFPFYILLILENVQLKDAIAFAEGNCLEIAANVEKHMGSSLWKRGSAR